jgi:hypothetical protein
MATYSLIASESTSQVLSPKVVNPVEYCTIQTHPSNVIASYSIAQAAFDQGAANLILDNYATNIEVLMSLGYVIAGQGTQTVDGSGLLQENVIFTVQYVPPDSALAGITADAVVPSHLIYGPGNTSPDSPGMKEAQSIIYNAYRNLEALAGV